MVSAGDDKFREELLELLTQIALDLHRIADGIERVSPAPKSRTGVVPADVDKLSIPSTQDFVRCEREDQAARLNGTML